MLPYFLERLSTIEGDASLLDTTAIIWGVANGRATSTTTAGAR